MSEDRTHDLRILRPTRCQLRYHRPVHLPESPCSFARFADVGLHKGLVMMKHGKPNLARGARFAFGLAGIGRFYEQPLSTYAVGEALALCAISCAFTDLLVCPIRRSWVPPPLSPRNKTNENLWMKRKVSLHSDPRPRSGSYFSVCLAEDPGSILGRGVILERFTAHHGQPFENAPQLASPQPDDLACGWTIGAAAFCGHHQAPTSLPQKITTSALLQSMY